MANDSVFGLKSFDKFKRDGAMFGICIIDGDELQVEATIEPTGVEVETKSCVRVSSKSSPGVSLLFHCHFGAADGLSFLKN